jgi:hypothetical protein
MHFHPPARLTLCCILLALSVALSGCLFNRKPDPVVYTATQIEVGAETLDRTQVSVPLGQVLVADVGQALFNVQRHQARRVTTGFVTADRDFEVTGGSGNAAIRHRGQRGDRYPFLIPTISAAKNDKTLPAQPVLTYDNGAAQIHGIDYILVFLPENPTYGLMVNPVSGVLSGHAASRNPKGILDASLKHTYSIRPPNLRLTLETREDVYYGSRESVSAYFLGPRDGGYAIQVVDSSGERVVVFGSPANPGFAGIQVGPFLLDVAQISADRLQYKLRDR